MSERENIQTIKDAYAAFQRGDVEAVLAKLTDDVEWNEPGDPAIPYAGTYHGRDGAAKFFRGLAEHDEVQIFDPQAYFAQGDAVVTLGRYASRVKSTGRTSDIEWVHVFRFRDGKVTSWRAYFDTAKAAKAYAVGAAV